MRRSGLLIGAVLLIGCLAVRLDAQQPRPKSRRVAVGPDADGDGVADAQDRCPNTPAGQRVGADGCPVRLLLPGEQPAPAANPPAANQAGAAGAPGAARPAAVTTQAAVEPTATGGAFTAGLSVAPYAGSSDADRDAYFARFTQMFDSAVVSLVNVFRNTTGRSVSGAESPTALSQRERDRWTRCRDLYFDLQTYQAALHDFLPRLPQTGTVPRTAAALDSALTAVQAPAECDNLASMIEAPARWTPWSAQYESSAQHFYRDWYNEVREADDRNRAFVMAFNAGRSAGARVPVPPALPRTPPYVGAGPR